MIGCTPLIRASSPFWSAVAHGPSMISLGFASPDSSNVSLIICWMTQWTIQHNGVLLYVSYAIKEIGKSPAHVHRGYMTRRWFPLPHQLCYHQFWLTRSLPFCYLHRRHLSKKKKVKYMSWHECNQFWLCIIWRDQYTTFKICIPWLGVHLW
jgi:hypothetical protein